MTIAVLGPGGVGGLVAGVLTRAGAEVVVIAREPTAETIAERGLSVRSAMFGDFIARVRARARLREPVDVLILATKAAGLDSALERVEIEPGLVLPLLNGLDHLAVLRDRFDPDTVLASTIRVESDRPEPGVIVHTSRFLLIDMATHSPSAPTGDAGAGADARARRHPRQGDPAGVRALGGAGDVVQARAPERARLHHQRL